MASTIGEFQINLDTDKRIRIWVDDTNAPTDTGVYKFWLKPTTKILLVLNEGTGEYTKVTDTEAIVASSTEPVPEEGKLWLDESTSPATLKKRFGSQWLPIPIGDMIIGNGGNATLQKVQFDQNFESTEIVQVLDIPNMLLTKKLVSGKISIQNLSSELQTTIYFKIKTTGKIIDQVVLYPDEFIALEYSDTYPVTLNGYGKFRIIFEGYVLN